MPLIPMIQGGRPLPNLPGPVLNREKAPTVDNSGVSKGVQLLANSQKMPDVPMSLAEPYQALGAVGKAIAQTGNVVSALAIKQREAESDIQIADFDSGASQVVADFESYKLENPNPSGWAKELQTRLTAHQTQTMEREDLHDGARQQIAIRAARYSGQALASVTASAAKETFAQAKSSFLAVADRATETQDAATFQETITTAKEKGYIYPHEAEAAEQRFKERGKQLEREARADEERKAFDAGRLQAIAKPREWLEENKEPKGNLDAWERLRNEAVQSLRVNTAGAVDEVTNAIAAGQLTVPAEIDAIESEFITPEIREQAKRYLATKNNFAEAQAQEGELGVRNAVNMRQKAKDYDPTTDKDAANYFALKQELNTLVPAGSREVIADILDAKITGRKPKPRPESEQYVNATLDAAYDPVHGAKQWRKKEWKEVWELDEKTGKEEKRFREVTVDDPEAREKSHAARAKAQRRIDEFLEANPNAPIEEVRKRTLEAIPFGDRNNNLENLSGKTPTASVGAVTSYGYANDETPDRNSSAGIGAWVPEEEQKKIKRGEDSPYKLREGDIAVSPDIEAQFKSAGVKPGDTIMVKLANGESRPARWMDRTAQDSDITSGRVKGVTKVLRGRFDFYSPGGKSKLDGVKVVGWSKPESLLAGN